MKYLFPRQFGLHNVFTSNADPRETAQPFKDYTLREQEITQAERRALIGGTGTFRNAMDRKPHLPKRLRGTPMALVKKLQILHSRCSYDKLLKRYCPIPVSRCRLREQVHSVLTRFRLAPV